MPTGNNQQGKYRQRQDQRPRSMYLGSVASRGGMNQGPGMQKWAGQSNPYMQGGGGGGPMYTGGSPNFNERTGQYGGGGGYPVKQPGRGPMVTFPENRGPMQPGWGGVNPPMGKPPIYGGGPAMGRPPMMPARAPGYFGGGPPGLDQRQQYQLMRQRAMMDMLRGRMWG